MTALIFSPHFNRQTFAYITHSLTPQILFALKLSLIDDDYPVVIVRPRG